VVLSFSVVSALLVTLVPLLTTIYRDRLIVSAYTIPLIFLVLLPVVSYIVTIIFNIFLQLIRCGKVNASQVLINGVPSVGLVALLGLLSNYISFLRYPVEGILPVSLSDNMKKGIAVSFYIFWGAVYGQALGGSLSQSC
jgi:hypothetical protein